MQTGRRRGWRGNNGDQELARTKASQQRCNLWIVLSQSGDEVCSVGVEAQQCTCPAHTMRRQKCKHIYAAECSIQKETRPDGTATVTKTLRVTYGQNWPPVNAAQAEEKRRFGERLADLTKLVQHHSQTRGARVSPSRIWRLRARARSSAAFRVGAS